MQCVCQLPVHKNRFFPFLPTFIIQNNRIVLSLTNMRVYHIVSQINLPDSSPSGIWPGVPLQLKQIILIEIM